MMKGVFFKCRSSRTSEKRIKPTKKPYFGSFSPFYLIQLVPFLHEPFRGLKLIPARVAQAGYGEAYSGYEHSRAWLCHSIHSSGPLRELP